MAIAVNINSERVVSFKRPFDSVLPQFALQVAFLVHGGSLTDRWGMPAGGRKEPTGVRIRWVDPTANLLETTVRIRKPQGECLLRILWLIALPPVLGALDPLSCSLLRLPYPSSCCFWIVFLDCYVLVAQLSSP